MKIRELEIVEREKRFQPAPPVVQPVVKEENPIVDESTRSTRKNGTKSRFSAAAVEPEENVEPISTSQVEVTPVEPQPISFSSMDAELKVISTNSCRKVEIQSGTTEKKNSSDDLRLTISKNRSKQVDNGDTDSNDEQKVTMNQIFPTTKDEKASK